MLLNILYIILLITLPFFVIFIIKKYFRKLDKIYSNITLTILSTFIGVFLAISLTLYTKEIDEKKLYISILQSDLNVCEEELSITNIILGYDKEKPESFFYFLKGIRYANDPFLLQEIMRNPYYYRYSSESFKVYLPSIVNLFRSLDLRITNHNYRLEFRMFKRYLVLRQTILSNEINFIENNIELNEVMKLNISAKRKLIDNVKAEVDSIDIIQLILKNEMDSLKNLIDSILYKYE
ncbi:MAG: hypothetical protein IIC75_00530 [Bacteroidetes bacterium]|nr:hypothetical protein [Bacteroidota bacterium]